MSKQSKLFKSICLLVAVAFMAASLSVPAYSAGLGLPAPTQFVPLSKTYSFPVLKGLKFDPNKPFSMQFIIDTANKKKITKKEAAPLIRYFLAALTIPEEDIWVNLSPYEKNRITSNGLSQTDLGKDLLSQDYILKQLTSSLTYPESNTGKVYWDQIYKEVTKIAGTTNIPINTFSKVWIVPDQAEVYENQNVALITQAKLKVLSEEDYLAMENNTNIVGEGLASSRNNKISNNQNATIQDNTNNNYTHSHQKREDARPSPTEEQTKINTAALKAMKDVILPKINQDVNSGKNFSKLRQIYNSIILGVWFKKKFKESIYKHYIDQNKLKGIDLKEGSKIKDKIYNTYVQAFKKGLYDYIKTDSSQRPKANGQKPIRRRYHSGGVFGSSALSVSNTLQTKYYLEDAASTTFIGSSAIISCAIDGIDRYGEPIDSAKYSKHKKFSSSSGIYNMINKKDMRIRRIKNLKEEGERIYSEIYRRGRGYKLDYENESEESLEKRMQNIKKERRKIEKNIILSEDEFSELRELYFREIGEMNNDAARAEAAVPNEWGKDYSLEIKANFIGKRITGIQESIDGINRLLDILKRLEIRDKKVLYLESLESDRSGITEYISFDDTFPNLVKSVKEDFNVVIIPLQRKDIEPGIEAKLKEKIKYLKEKSSNAMVIVYARMFTDSERLVDRVRLAGANKLLIAMNQSFPQYEHWELRDTILSEGDYFKEQFNWWKRYNFDVSTASSSLTLENKRPTILIVDDMEDIRDNLAEILEVWGYNTITAENDKVALEKLRNNKCDAALLDTNLYGYGDNAGIKLTKIIKQNNPEIGIIQMSADDGIKNIAIESGASDFYEKGESFDSLKAMIAKSLKKPNTVSSSGINQLSTINKAQDFYGGITLDGMDINPAQASSAVSGDFFRNCAGLQFQIIKIDYPKNIDSVLNLP